MLFRKAGEKLGSTIAATSPVRHFVLLLRTSPALGFLLSTFLYLGPVTAEENSPTISLSQPLEEGFFIDISGEKRSLKTNYDSWFGKRRGTPRYGMAAIGNAGILAIGLTYYWIRADFNSADWDRPSVLDRVTLDAWRFDNNSNLFNHILHPFGGANFYGIARINNLSVLESAIYVSLSSFIWEFALEWRELVSINDLIFTPVSGIAVGEFLFQMGEYVTSTRPNKPWHHVGAYTFGIYRTLNGYAYSTRERLELPRDSLGFSSAFWHRFHVEGEYIALGTKGQVERFYGLSAKAEIVALPGFARPGNFSKRFTNGNFSRGEFDIALGSDGGFDTDLFFDTNLYGRYHQNYTQSDGASGQKGYATLFGLTTAFRFSDHSFSDRKDQVAVVHAAGPNARYWYQNGDFRAQFSIATTLDFAAIRSLAFDEWRQTQDVSGVKSVLLEKSYQYHYGASARTEIESQYKGFALGLSGALGVYDSLEGYDRKQEAVRDDVSGQEMVVEYGSFWQLPIPKTPLSLRLSIDRFGRKSTIESLTVKRWDTRITTGIGAIF